MKKYLTLLIFVTVVVCLFPVLLLAQMTGDKYKISTSSVVGGGGTSSATAFMLTGGVPLMGAAGISSNSYGLISGPTGISYGSMVTLSTSYTPVSSVLSTTSDYTLRVAYSGGSGDATGIFYYRDGGISTSFDSLPMTAGTTDELRYLVTGNSLSLRGLEYYFEINRGIYSNTIGSASSPMVFKVALASGEAYSTNATVANKYRIIGVPLAMSGDVDIMSVFTNPEHGLGEYNTSKWRIGRYNSATNRVDEFNNAPGVIPGRGYWLITSTPKTFGVRNGISVYPDQTVDGVKYYEVPLANGWNQLGNPFAFKVAWDEIRFSVNGTAVVGHPVETLEDVAYSFNGSGYDSHNAILPWTGVFVKINQANVSALIPYKETNTALKIRPLKDQTISTVFSWNIEVQLKTNDFLDKANFVGVRPDALDSPDIYDFSEPPPAPSAPRLGFRIADDDRLRRTDFRAPFTDGAIWQIEISKAAEREINIVGLKNMPDNMEAWIVTDDGQKYDLLADTEINLPDKILSAQLIIGSRAYTTNEIASLLPVTFALEQNYPNPFNPQTSIGFALPTNGFTTLEIYNVLGQKVKTLIDKEMPAGFYTVTWNGDDNNGKTSASGIYFYRLLSGENSTYKKMLLIK